MNINRKYRYKHFFYKDKQGRDVVAAVSSFAGRSVKGLAICDHNDEFDMDSGIMLANARCNAKISHKRFARAEKKLAEAAQILEDAQAYYDKMARYYNDASEAMFFADNEVLCAQSDLA